MVVTTDRACCLTGCLTVSWVNFCQVGVLLLYIADEVKKMKEVCRLHGDVAVYYKRMWFFSHKKPWIMTHVWGKLCGFIHYLNQWSLCCLSSVCSHIPYCLDLYELSASLYYHLCKQTHRTCNLLDVSRMNVEHKMLLIASCQMLVKNLCSHASYNWRIWKAIIMFFLFNNLLLGTICKYVIIF
jgi:hypothetical protein